MPDRVQRNARITCRSGDVPVPEQFLDDTDVEALFQEMGGEAVPQCMDGNRSVEPSGTSGLTKQALQLPGNQFADTAFPTLLPCQASRKEGFATYHPWLC